MNLSSIAEVATPETEENDLLDITYSELVDEIGAEVIDNRKSHLLKKARAFIKICGFESSFFVNSTLVDYVLIDYFSDISKLKKFSGIQRINKNKITGYTVYWWLKRKPIQVREGASIVSVEDIGFINEKFATSLIAKDLLFGRKSEIQSNKKINEYIDLVFYNLKYRHYTQRSLELAIASFSAGIYVGESSSTDE